LLVTDAEGEEYPLLYVPLLPVVVLPAVEPGTPDLLEAPPLKPDEVELLVLPEELGLLPAEPLAPVDEPVLPVVVFCVVENEPDPVVVFGAEPLIVLPDLLLAPPLKPDEADEPVPGAVVRLPETDVLPPALPAA
jgi:hypothetical protein